MGEKAGKGRPAPKRAIAAAAVLVLAVVFFHLFRGTRAKGQPADFAIEGSVLIVLDKQKNELWPFDTGMEDLEDESFYRAHFQSRDHNAGNVLPAIVIRDIDGDGDNEVLFAPKRNSDQTGEGVLHCFDSKGVGRWSFRAGRELRCGGTVYSPDYRIAGFDTHDLDGDGRREIVVEAYHAPQWPCQLSVLDSAGNSLGEFWNAGYLRDVEYVDLDGDGREEIVVVGVNNEYRTGCLAVLDAGALGGGSPQSGEFACEGIEPGRELFYLTVPRTDVTEALGSFTSDLLMVELTGNRRIRTTSSLGLIYEFDLDLRPLQVTPSHGYIARHESLTKEGRISSVLDDAYAKALLDGVRFWNGSEWSSEPARNAPPAPGPGESR